MGTSALLAVRIPVRWSRTSPAWAARRRRALAALRSRGPQWCHRAMVTQRLADTIGVALPEIGHEQLPAGQHPLRSARAVDLKLLRCPVCEFPYVVRPRGPIPRTCCQRCTLALALHRAYLRGRSGEMIGLLNKDIVASAFLAQRGRHQTIIDNLLADEAPNGEGHSRPCHGRRISRSPGTAHGKRTLFVVGADHQRRRGPLTKRPEAVTYERTGEP